MTFKDKKILKMKIPYASRFEIALCVALACVNIGLLAVFCEFLNVSAALSAVIISAMYLIEVSVLDIKHKARLKSLPRRNIYSLLEEDGSVVIKNSLYPVIAMDIRGTVLWYNDSMRAIINSEETFVGKNVEELFSADFDVEDHSDMVVVIRDRKYKVEGFKVSDEGDGLYIAMLSDITALSEAEKKYTDERVAVAYIAIDNVEDVLQYVQEKFADAVINSNY